MPAAKEDSPIHFIIYSERWLSGDSRLKLASLVPWPGIEGCGTGNWRTCRNASVVFGGLLVQNIPDCWKPNHRKELRDSNSRPSYVNYL